MFLNQKKLERTFLKLQQIALKFSKKIQQIFLKSVKYVKNRGGKSIIFGNLKTIIKFATAIIDTCRHLGQESDCLKTILSPYLNPIKLTFYFHIVT